LEIVEVIPKDFGADQ